MLDKLTETMERDLQLSEPVGKRPVLSLVIPAYNEETSIGSTLDDVLELAEIHNWEIIVVDDGSNDSTVQQVEQRTSYLLNLIRHPYNRGYGASIKTGIRQASAP